jgi:hypothetical protein
LKKEDKIYSNIIHGTDYKSAPAGLFADIAIPSEREWHCTQKKPFQASGKGIIGRKSHSKRAGMALLAEKAIPSERENEK